MTMLDFIGTIVIVATMVVAINATISSLSITRFQRLAVALAVGVWIGLASAFASSGLLAVAEPFPYIGAFVVLPLVAAAALAAASPEWRAALIGLPMPLLVGIEHQPALGRPLPSARRRGTAERPLPVFRRMGRHHRRRACAAGALACLAPGSAGAQIPRGVEHLRRARSDRGGRSRHHLRPGFAVPTLRSGKCLGGPGDALVVHPDRPGAVLSDRARDPLRAIAPGADTWEHPIDGLRGPRTPVAE